MPNKKPKKIIMWGDDIGISILCIYTPRLEVFNGQWKLPKMRLAEKT